MNWSPYNNEDTRDRQQSGCVLFLGFFMILCLFIVGLFGFKLINDWYRGLPDQDSIVEPIDDAENDVVISNLNDTYIVRVYETEAQNSPVWLIKFLDDDEFWYEWVPNNLKGMATVDPNSDPERATTFLDVARKRNIEPPFIVHAKSDGDVISVIKVDESLSTDKLKSRLQRGK